MTTIRTVAILFLVTALDLFGQSSANPISIDPPDPTSNDSITMFVQQFDSCPPPPTVRRSGFDIDVTVNFGTCLCPPSLITHAMNWGSFRPASTA